MLLKHERIFFIFRLNTFLFHQWKYIEKEDEQQEKKDTKFNRTTYIIANDINSHFIFFCFSETVRTDSQVYAYYRT